LFRVLGDGNIQKILKTLKIAYQGFCLDFFSQIGDGIGTQDSFAPERAAAKNRLTRQLLRIARQRRP